MEKKNPFIMTIGFNKNNQNHLQVAELLNSMNRGKAQYIVDAVLAYRKLQQVTGSSLISDNLSLDYQNIRQIVLKILEEKELMKPDLTIGEMKKNSDSGNDSLDELDRNAVDEIIASLEAFRAQ